MDTDERGSDGGCRAGPGPALVAPELKRAMQPMPSGATAGRRPAKASCPMLPRPCPGRVADRILRSDSDSPTKQSYASGTEPRGRRSILKAIDGAHAQRRSQSDGLGFTRSRGGAEHDPGADAKPSDGPLAQRGITEIAGAPPRGRPCFRALVRRAGRLHGRRSYSVLPALGEGRT